MLHRYLLLSVILFAIPLWSAEDAAMEALRTQVEPAVAALEAAEAALSAAADQEPQRAAAIAQLDAASVIRGSDGWLYTLADLRHHAAGIFWGPAAADVAVASRNPDPLPAISDFADQVRRAGARLIVIPVPSKVLGHGEHLDPALDHWRDPAREAFIAALREAQVEVLDLLPAFHALREQQVPVHLTGDSHWSPQAMAQCAELIRGLVADPPWLSDLTPAQVSMTELSRDVRGDLASRIDGPREEIVLQAVQLNGAAHVPAAQSPIVLMGDSHGLVFGHQDLLATEAGLADHLAARFGQAIDVVAAQGSGANASRATLARRGDNLAGKKLVIWVFAERELSRSTSGWPRIPVVR